MSRAQLSVKRALTLGRTTLLSSVYPHASSCIVVVVAAFFPSSPYFLRRFTARTVYRGIIFTAIYPPALSRLRFYPLSRASARPPPPRAPEVATVCFMIAILLDFLHYVFVMRRAANKSVRINRRPPVCAKYRCIDRTHAVLSQISRCQIPFRLIFSD